MRLGAWRRSVGAGCPADGAVRGGWSVGAGLPAPRGSREEGAAGERDATPRLGHVYLRGHVRRRDGFITTAGMHAKLGFTLTSAPHMLPLAGVEFFNWTRYRKVHGGYAPNSNGFFLAGAHRRLRRHVRVTVRGHPVAFSLKPEGDSGMAIYLKRPAPRFRVVVSSPALEFGRQAIRAAEHHRAARVHMTIRGWDQIGEGYEHEFRPHIKARVLVRERPVRIHRHHHRGQSV